MPDGVHPGAMAVRLEPASVMDQDYLEKNYGNENARAYWQVAEDAKALVRELIKDQRIKCHPVDGIIHADHRKRYLERQQGLCGKTQQQLRL